MATSTQKRPAEEEPHAAKKARLDNDAHTETQETSEPVLSPETNNKSASAQPTLKRKPASDKQDKNLGTDALPATPAHSLSSTSNSTDTPTAPNTRLSSPQHVFGATSSFGNAGSFSKSSFSKVKAEPASAGPHVFGTTSSFGKSFEDIKNRPNVFASLTSKLQDSKDNKEPATITSSFGANSKFGNAFQESLKKKSFLDNASEQNSEEPDDRERSETPQQFKQVELAPVENKTGEEDEKTIFTCTAKLFELDLTNIADGWKERGLGPLHLNQSISSPQQVRLVMRSQGLIRVILNMKINVDTKLIKGLEASLSPGKFLRANTINAQGRPVQHLLKFGSEEIRNGLFDEVEKLRATFEKNGEKKQKSEKNEKEEENNKTKEDTKANNEDERNDEAK